MKLTIRKGRHYPAFPINYPWIGVRRISRTVHFDDSCAYDIGDYNQKDVNKLFGLSFGLFAIHKNSARFGWYWNKQNACIDLVAYCYSKGQKNWDEQLRYPVVAAIPLGVAFECDIHYVAEGGYCIFNVHLPDDLTGPSIFVGSQVVTMQDNLPCFGLTHGLYFGGVLTAPHTMSIELSKSPFS